MDSSNAKNTFSGIGGGRRGEVGTGPVNGGGSETRRATDGRPNDDGDHVVCRLIVSNLNYWVSSADVRGLFEKFGPLRTAAVRYGRSGRSRGTADVIYVSEKSALEAVRRYRNAYLDGRFVKIRLVMTDRRQSAGSTGPTLRGMRGNRPARTVRNAKKTKPSFKDVLDAELDEYMQNRNG